MFPSEESASLTNIAEGAAIELFDLEMQKVLNNIDDPNRDILQERTLNLEVKFKPTQTHGVIETLISVKSKLAARKTVSAHLLVGKSALGHVEAHELKGQQQPLPFGNDGTNLKVIGKEARRDDVK